MSANLPILAKLPQANNFINLLCDTCHLVEVSIQHLLDVQVLSITPRNSGSSMKLMREEQRM